MKQIMPFVLLPFICLNHVFAQHIDKSQYAIFPYNDSEEFVSRKFPSNCVKSNLTEIEIGEIGPILDKCIKEYNEKQEQVYKDIHEKYPEAKREDFMIDWVGKYKFQFIVSMTPQGYKTIWVNCFCTRSEDEWEKNNWQKQVIHVFDGGKCYFNLMIDLTRKFYYDFSVNGNG